MDTGRTDIGGLDHRDIVSAIADTAHPLFRVRADQTRDISFLCRRTTAGDDGGQLRRQLDKVLTKVLDAELFVRTGQLGIGLVAPHKSSPVAIRRQ